MVDCFYDDDDDEDQNFYTTHLIGQLIMTNITTHYWYLVGLYKTDDLNLRRCWLKLKYFVWEIICKCVDVIVFTTPIWL